MSTTNTAVAEVKKGVDSQVLQKIAEFESTGEMKLPKDYSYQNALKSAYMKVTDPKNNVLEKCTKSSVAEAFFKMIQNGLSPMKNQCYFVAYGDKLELSISYAGNIAIAKRYGNLKKIKGNAIFEGDTFEFEVDTVTGRRKVTKHLQTLESVGSNKIKGAYAVFELNDGTVDVEVMNFNQIQTAWNQGGSKGNSPAHKNFADQMAIKTVLNRACKLLISTSDDSALYDPLNEEIIDVTDEDVKHEIKTKANKQSLDFENNIEDAVVVDPETIVSEKLEFEEASATGPNF